MALQVDQLRWAARHQPDEVAYIDLVADSELTFAEWDARSNALARGMVAAGVAPGDRVGLHIDSSHLHRWIVAYCAIHKAGAVAVPTNTRLSARELGTIWNHAEPVLVLTSIEHVRTVVEARPTSLRRIVEDETELASPDRSDIQVPRSDDDLADIMYTSGTTGLPKGIAVRHANTHIIPNGEPAWTGERWIHASPLFTFAGLAFAFNPQKMGMTGMYLSRFDCDAWFDAVEARRPTCAFLVPAMAQLLVGHARFADVDLTSLSLVSIGSAPLAPALHIALAERLPDAAVSNSYSMTEAGTAFTFMPPGEVRNRQGSVGIVMPPTQIRIADENGEPVPTGEVGEVLIGVGGRAREYYKDPEATAATWRDGWLRSGDLGRLDEDGYLYIVGRSKDVIIRGGNNVYPSDVEAVLYEHPAVAEAAVAGVAHPVLGEEIAAYVVAAPGTSPTADELRRHCAAGLADYKVPRHYVFVEALPRNAMGKVLKAELSLPEG